MLHVIDRGTNIHSYYVTEGWALKINSFTYARKGFILDWTLASPNEVFKGTTQKELFDILKNLKEKYQLKVRNKFSKDILVIYTDNILKAQGFLQRIITDQSFSLYFQILDNIEFRQCWKKDIETAEEMAIWCDVLIKTIFVPEKQFYISAGQVSRIRCRKLKKILKLLYDEIAPETYVEWQFLRKALFGGLYYCQAPNIYDYPCLGLDLISAYIWCLCCKKHVVTKFTKIDSNNWKQFLDNDDEASLGRYIIKYRCVDNYIDCFKDYYGNSLRKSENPNDLIEVDIVLNNIDLKLISWVCDSIEIECVELYSAKLDYLPKELIDSILKEFIKKCDLKSGDPNAYKLQKIILNAYYGNTIPKYNSREEWKNKTKKEVLPPQWGIWTTSYCKELIILLGQSLGEDWYYSGVDSIYCKDTEEAHNNIDLINRMIRNQTETMCKQRNIDFEKVKDLGTFDIENHIEMLRTFKKNQYVYKSKEKGLVVKASGCDKKQLDMDLDFYTLDKIPAGERILGEIRNEKVSLDLNGRHFESDGYYFEDKADMDTEVGKLKMCIYWMLHYL